MYISRVENGHTVPAIETLEKLARALEVPLYQLFYDGEEPPKLPNLPKRKSSEDIAWEVPARTGAFLTSFVACWLKLRSGSEAPSAHGPENGSTKEWGEPQATKTGLPGWMRIAVRIRRKGLKPHRSGAARGDKMDCAARSAIAPISRRFPWLIKKGCSKVRHALGCVRSWWAAMGPIWLW